MADSNLQQVIQLSLTEPEAKLLSWTLALARATSASDVEDQLESAVTIKMLMDATDSPFNDIVQRLARLTKAGFPDAKWHESDCNHYSCDSKICCWCGEEKL